MPSKFHMEESFNTDIHSSDVRVAGSLKCLVSPRTLVTDARTRTQCDDLLGKHHSLELLKVVFLDSFETKRVFWGRALWITLGSDGQREEVAKDI